MNVRVGISAISLIVLIAPGASGAEMALSFDNDAVLLPAQVFDGLTDFTVELWVRPDAGSPAGGDPTMLSLVNDSPPNTNVFFIETRQAGDGFLIGGLGVGGNPILQFGPPIEFGRWYHLAIIREGTVARVYVDGQPSGEVTVTTNPLDVPNNGAFLGQELDCVGGCFTLSQAFWGQIDELRVWGAARSDVDIQANYDRRLCGDEQGLVGYWRFDETTGQVAFDASGHGFDATLGTDPNAPDPFDPLRMVSDAPIGPPSADCNMALSFNDDAVLLPAQVFDGLTDFTVELWVRPAAGSPAGGDPTMLSLVNDSPPNTNVFFIETRQAGDGFLIGGLGVSGNPILQFGPSIEFERWYHLAIIREGTVARVYVDGQPAGEVTVTSNPLDVPSNGAFLGQELDCVGGCFTLSQAFWGQIDELRVWGAARSDVEIQANYDRRLCGDEQGLVAYWRFDETTGQVAFDASGHGFDATLGTDPNAPDPFDPLRMVSDAPIGPPSADCNTIPTVSEWGLVVMSLLVLTAGTLVYARRRPDRA